MDASDQADKAVGTLDIVVPVFNEEAIIPQLVERFGAVCEAAAPGIVARVIAVNDGSTDRSRELLDDAATTQGWLTAVHFSRNFGHQAAVTAGLDRSEADFVCIIDGDLQDPPELIIEMLDTLVAAECDVVYGQRTHRQGETRFKLWTATAFYRLLRRLSGIDIPLDTGDFRVMTRRLNLQLRQLPEHHRFLRALIPWIGFPSVAFPYERQARTAGETKYSLSKMFSLASHAMASFSSAPLRLTQYLGALLTGVGTAMFVIALAIAIFGQAGVGLLLVSSTIVFIGGIIVGSVAIVGGYVVRVQDEVKGRPLYVIDRITVPHMPGAAEVPTDDVIGTAGRHDVELSLQNRSGSSTD